MTAPKPKPQPDDPLDALELLAGAADDPTPLSRPTPVDKGGAHRPESRATTGPHAPPVPPPGSPRILAPDEDLSTPSSEPRWRCVACGYPIADALAPTCPECGRKYTRADLEYWDSEAERWRFERVQWLVLAALFLKLLVLPQLMGISRILAAGALFWACYIAHRGKQGSVGGMYAVGGMVATGLMVLAYSAQGNLLPYYVLEIIALCVLMRAMFHDPTLGAVGETIFGRRAALVVLFATPVLAIVLYAADQVMPAWPTTPTAVGPGILAPPISGVPTWATTYAPFSMITPFMLSLAWGAFVCWTLATARKVLFGDANRA